MRWLVLLSLATTIVTAAPAPAKKKAVSAKAPAKHATKSKGRSRKVSRPSYQMHPDADRYTEIQKALAERGYYKGEANGEWKDDSADALRRFQSDQKLPSDGKITALSLSALGLGPKHDGSAASTVPAAAPPLNL